MNGLEGLYARYRRNKLKVWIVLVVGLPLLLLAGSLLIPDLFWERFLWRYFWGPVVADAEGRPVDGVGSGYNPVNTVTYASVLVTAFFGIYEIIDHFDIKIDRSFVYSLLPWIVLGGSLRSLEDVGLFRDPLDKIMITPLIYFVLGISAISLLVIGAKLARIGLKKKKEQILRLFILLPFPISFFLLSPFLAHHTFVFYLIAFSVLAAAYILGSRFFAFNEKYLLFSYGFLAVFVSLFYNIYYIFELESSNPLEVVFIPGLGLGLTLLFLSASKAVDHLFGTEERRKIYELFTHPLNLLICFSHLFDASSTYRGVTAYGYAEKHVLPAILIEASGTPLSIFLIKLLLIISVVYLIDVHIKDELSDRKTLPVLLKFLIIVLGTGPAVRNTLRLAMGV
ncbi:MAG: DUF63 family protein [Candidatus Natronoplasma sp.]